MSGELIAAVCMLLLWGLCAVLIIRAIRKPKRQANAALAQLNDSLRLTECTTREGLWPSSREQFNWGTWPVLQGSRGAYRFEVTVQPGGRHQSPLTWVTVSGPRELGGRILVSRLPEMLTFSMKSLNPFARTQTPDDTTDLRAFSENTRTFYDRDALARLFTAPVRSKVLGLPRRWMNVGFDGSAMLIAWQGMETDAAIVQQAFRMGEECLELLGEGVGRGQRQKHAAI